MRTTIRLDDELLAAAKRYAADTGQSLTSVLDAALRQMLAQREQIQKRPPVRLKTVTGRGPKRGVDLDDSASLLELMENNV